jgi:tRNA threonylcarbamoyladenosine biosynthesis protein TsaE
MKDFLSLISHNPLETAAIGSSLAKSLYDPQSPILLTGELGAGKTTFAQGLARGLGIQDTVTSPTFALEQRYEEKFLHIDLYRLHGKSTEEILRGSEEFPGIRLIEWPERTQMQDDHAIDISITPLSEAERTIDIDFCDAEVPSDDQIQEWIDGINVLPNIRAHLELVAECAEKCSAALLKRQIIVRPKALRAAALLHDLFRFLDFPKDEKKEEPPSWNAFRDRFQSNHEKAAQEFLNEKGFPVIGSIIRTHGAPRKEDDKPITTEQKILSYCDKRALHDTLVSVDERFDDFLIRSRTSTPEFLEEWRAMTKNIEKELFEGDLPF